MEFIITEKDEDVRLDRFLKKTFKDEPLSYIYKIIRTGIVKINGSKKKENYRLKLNDTVVLLDTFKDKIVKEKKIDENVFIKKELYKNRKLYDDMIHFENENFFIINKKNGMAMHKGTNVDFGLAEIYKKYYQSEEVNFLNRLDKETSGLVIGCKNSKYLRYLSEKMRNREIEKYYVAKVHGVIKDEEKILENFLREDKDKVRIAEVAEKDNRKSILKYKKINNGLLEIELLTGRKHQIRVQLANIGNPILGDRKYGLEDNEKKLNLLCYKVIFDNYNFQIDYSDFF